MNNDIMYNYNNRTLQCIKNELFFSKIYRRPVFSGLKWSQDSKNVFIFFLLLLEVKHAQIDSLLRF